MKNKPDLKLGDSQLILAECEKRGLTTSQTAYVMATAWWETAHTMKPVEEAFWVKNPDAWRRKNLRYYPWHGRGYVQITWQGNYVKAGKKLDRDLTTDPDAVMIPKIAAEILVLGSLEGWFTGKKLGDYINGTKRDFIQARRIINGTDKAKEIAKVADAYEVALLSNQKAIKAETPRQYGLSAMLAAFFKKWIRK